LDEHETSVTHMPQSKIQNPKSKIALVAAMSENRVIGRDNSLPWHLPADLKHFKRLTTGHAVIMGRKTFESMGKPLPNRTNIIVTRDREYSVAEATIANSLDEALQCAGQEQEIFILGGGELFRAALPMANRMYLTLIHAHINGDVHFPEFDETQWMLISDDYRPADAENPHAMSFRQYDRRPR
jgi:dihydrofolate reductase